ncbi:MAG: tetratricopeptide repeat protein [Bryobacteraceae bacterium]
MPVRTLFVCLLIAIPSAAAQSALMRHEGKLITAGSADALWVELYDHPGHILAGRVPVSRDGDFTVNAASTQLYELRVVNSHGTRIITDHVQFRQGQPVEIRLPASPTNRPAPAGPISALRLGHKPIKAARRLVREADSLAENGNLTASAELLQRALAADPNWFEAWNNLGSRRLTLGQYAESLDAFRHAFAIDPNNAAVHSNIGLAQLFLRQPVEAEQSARRSLQLEPGSPRASYVSGMALLRQNKRTAEALDALRLAATVIPRALLATAEWHCRHNDLEACEADLKTFLRTPRGPNHETAEKWLTVLKRQQARQ